MNLTAWRMVKTARAADAFDGEGARLFGGRWNSPGVRMVYASQYRSLAVLEILVHLEGVATVPAFRFFPIEFEEALVEDLAEGSLPAEWKDPVVNPVVRQVGDEWVRRGRKPVLRVPSAILPAESNYLFNPGHPDFARLRRGNPEDWRLDPRLR